MDILKPSPRKLYQRHSLALFILRNYICATSFSVQFLYHISHHISVLHSGALKPPLSLIAPSHQVHIAINGAKFISILEPRSIYQCYFECMFLRLLNSFSNSKISGLLYRFERDTELLMGRGWKLPCWCNLPGKCANSGVQLRIHLLHLVWKAIENGTVRLLNYMPFYKLVLLLLQKRTACLKWRVRSPMEHIKSIR